MGDEAVVVIMRPLLCDLSIIISEMQDIVAVCEMVVRTSVFSRHDRISRHGQFGDLLNKLLRIG